MIEYGYITGILARFEGRAIGRGYIPCRQGTWYPGGADKGDILGQSGVTIATGVDLGQQTEKGFAGLPAALLDKLRPYLGLKRGAAKAALIHKPLELSSEEVKQIDELIHKRYIDETAVMFGRTICEAAPKQVQAVAVSLHYQFGTPRRKESPALEQAWEALRRGEYRKAAGYLRNHELWSKSHRAYMARRDMEARLLESAV
jgi:GH24 family phage-related lysozyme (muramidase)